jgi:hypothetical protein
MLGMSRLKPFIEIISVLSIKFLQGVLLAYLWRTIALVGKVNGRFGAKRAEVTFRPFYL